MVRRYLFSGRVQGVGFRWTVSRLATEFPVSGYVRNLTDGRVELVADGSASAMDDLVAAVRQHFRGNIESVDTTDLESEETFERFEIRR